MSFREPQEDLFEESRMSFGEHLEELRKVLVRAIIGVALGCVIGFYFADNIIAILTRPLSDAVTDYEVKTAEQLLTEKYGYIPPEYRPLLLEGFVPQFHWVDPGELVGNLQTVVPNFGEKVDLDPYGFRAENFKPDEIVALCQRLIEPESAASPAVVKLTALLDSLPTNEQATIRQIANSPSMSSDEELVAVTRVMAIFNRLTKSDEFYQNEAFASDFIKPAWSLFEAFQEKEDRPLADLKTTLDNPETSALDRPNVRRRLNRAIIASLFPEQINEIRLGVRPMQLWKQVKFRPQALSPTEGFFVWLKAGIFSGLTIAGPWVFYQLWVFVAAGLYPHEKKYIHMFLPISILLFVAGVLLAFFFVFQPVLGFLFSFNRSMGIAPQMRIGEWLSFAMFLPLGFGVAFQLPLVMLFLNRIDLISIETYISKWRIAVMVIFVLSMFLTPADPISLLLLAIPLTALYFLGIGMCRWLPKPENPFAETAVR